MNPTLPIYCLLLIFIQLITGCSSARYNFGPTNNANLTPVLPEQVKVFKAGSPPPGPYEVVAAVTRLAMGNGNKLEELKAGAGKLGADAIIGLHEEWGVNGQKNWAQSGIAVRFNSTGTNGERQFAKSSMALVPFIEMELQIPRVPRPIVMKMFRNAIEHHAQNYLFNKGYNAIYADVPLPSGVDVPPQVSFDLLNGKEAYLCESMLVLRLAKNATDDFGLFGAIGHYAITAELISKETGKVEWRATATKAKGGTGSHANSLDTDLVGMLVSKVLRNLPMSQRNHRLD